VERAFCHYKLIRRMIAYLVLYRRMWHKMMAQSLGRTASSPRLTRAADRARRPMFRLMHEMRVRIMIALVDPLAADADLAAASWAGIHRLKSHGGFGRRWVRYGELTFRPRLTIGGAG
jgi:hypothetical protein